MGDGGSCGRARRRALAALAAFAISLSGARSLRADDAARAANASARANGSASDWPLHGRDAGEQRASPLAQIRRENLRELGLAWSYATGSKRGLEATPIVSQGVLYATSSWSIVFALDAATGRELWRFDPEVPRAVGRDACCDAVNRGVALWQGRVYFGALDGRLFALDAATGKRLWEVQTVDRTRPYTITGAPRVVKGRVIIGNGGADFGVRGHVSAYDAATGALAWRFYTVPANKHGPFEHPELARAAETWSEDSLFESGLGGTVWDSLAYDPELDLLYVGTGNASVYDRHRRSPGGGDNLFLASILALRPDTGRLVWHYQTTPAESWDYTATQQLILADLVLGGRPRKVLMQAPKNGFFFVLDRATGELLSADAFAHVSWASGIDVATGRPIPRPEADWHAQPRMIAPGVMGAHSWHPMAFSAQTGLVYIPSIELAYRYEPDPAFRYQRGHFNTAEDLGAMSRTFEGFERAKIVTCAPTRLVAWDPVLRRKRWEVARNTAVPAGVLATAGGLVFQGGDASGLSAFDALSGEKLWNSGGALRIMAPPVSYAVGGAQYVAVLAGIGGSAGTHFTELGHANEGQLLAFALGGRAPMPDPGSRAPAVVSAPELALDDIRVARGRELYSRHCLRCHGVGAASSGLYPDLRFASREVHERWNDIVLGGIRAGGGMASFADVIDAEGAGAIHAYVVSRALHEPTALERGAAWLAERACVPVSWITD
jgi:quinohemoprotein ethanol dehydrogenase